MDFDNELTEKIIGAAIEVHRLLGPGLLESTYEKALCIELELIGLKHECQVAVPVIYKGRTIGEYRIDLIVADEVVVEVKSVERFDPIFEAQILTYLKVTGKHIGLLINFNNRLLKDGIKRFIK
ncbi:MAG TPA: GxxExxY protein [Candidatus Acidoferrum sp.]|nr:GxxExxY protein [Candidatus Acidoferrum sp.]